MISNIIFFFYNFFFKGIHMEGAHTNFTGTATFSCRIGIGRPIGGA